jgi:hypothetical protein
LDYEVVGGYMTPMSDRYNKAGRIRLTLLKLSVRELITSVNRSLKVNTLYISSFQLLCVGLVATAKVGASCKTTGDVLHRIRNPQLQTAQNPPRGTGKFSASSSLHKYINRAEHLGIRACSGIRFWCGSLGVVHDTDETRHPTMQESRI